MRRDRAQPGAPLVLEWTGGSLRLPLGITGRIEQVDELIPVPGAPQGVIGLGEARGRAVTLLCPSLFLPSWPRPVCGRETRGAMEQIHGPHFASPRSIAGVPDEDSRKRGSSQQCFSCDSAAVQDPDERSSRHGPRSQVSVLTFASPHEHLGVLVTRETTLRRADKADEDLTLVDEAYLERTVGLLSRSSEAIT